MKFRAEIDVVGHLSAEFEAESQIEADKTLLDMIAFTRGEDGVLNPDFPWQHYYFLIGEKRAVEIE